MRRDAIAFRIKPGKEDEFALRCKQIPEAVLAPENPQVVSNFSVWRVEDLVFCYGEIGDAASPDAEKAFVQGFLAHMRDCCECLGDPFGNPMRLMYEDIGIVREDKSKIRHRVFVTRLKPGMAEEYKRRHDALVESRGGKVNPGPESDFTIWYAAGHIFGYCELDRAMLHEPTPEERQATVAWETRQLEIMDWLTDDVDWLTGLKHEKIQLVFRQ